MSQEPGSLDLDIPLASLLLLIYSYPFEGDSFELEDQINQLSILAELFEIS